MVIAKQCFNIVKLKRFDIIPEIFEPITQNVPLCLKIGYKEKTSKYDFELFSCYGYDILNIKVYFSTITLGLCKSFEIINIELKLILLTLFSETKVWNT